MSDNTAPLYPIHLMALVSLRVEHDIALLVIDRPPVNAISTAVTAELADAVDAFLANPQPRALVLCASGRTFVAGGDIAEFEQPGFSAQPFNRVLARLEGSPRLVIAALHGTVLGGGLELALACHYRVAQPGTRFGFPEVKLGLLPGSLGTQRLPRLAGAPAALDMILGGNPIGADDAHRLGIVDEIQAGAPEAIGATYAGVLLARAAPPRRASELSVPGAHDAALFAERRHALAAACERHPAVGRIIDCVEAAATLPFPEGEAREARAFQECLHSPQSKAMRHLFFAERETSRIPGVDPASARPVATVGVVGAGTMGSGIAMAFASAGISVVLAEATSDNLARGLATVRKTFESSATKGRISREDAVRRTDLVRGTLAIAEVASCDLVIEAVFEDLALKCAVIGDLGRRCKPGAIIATNTSTLDVDVLARASGRPADVVGLHFFSPAHVMRLLEIVRGRATSPEVLATALHVAKRIGKIPVVAGVCYGFIGNRMIEPYLREAEFMLLEGGSPATIDRALESLGLAMGPLRMLDLAGVDVAARIAMERQKCDPSPDPAYRTMVRRLYDRGRLGHKAGLGFYRYEGQRAVADPDLDTLAATLARELRVAPRQSPLAPDEVVERCLYPLINEGARILEEGIALRPGDIDVVFTRGFGFPDFAGGPMWMADAIGVPRIVERMDHYARQRGNAYGYWNVAPLLRECAATGRRLSDWRTGS